MGRRRREGDDERSRADGSELNRTARGAAENKTSDLSDQKRRIDAADDPRAHRLFCWVGRADGVAGGEMIVGRGERCERC